MAKLLFFFVWGGLRFGCTSIFFGHGLRVRSCDRPPSRGLILRKRRPGAGTTVLFALEVAKLAPAFLFYKWVLRWGFCVPGGGGLSWVSDAMTTKEQVTLTGAICGFL